MPIRFFLYEFNDSFYREENTCNAMKVNVRWTNDCKLRSALFIFFSFLLPICIYLRVVICSRIKATSTHKTHAIASRERRKKETHIDCSHFVRREPCVCVVFAFVESLQRNVILSHFPVSTASTRRSLHSRVQIM